MRWLPAVLALLPAAAPAEPGFDCARAGNAAEKAICADENGDIALRDAALARLYAALKAEGSHDALLAKQKPWLAQRDACGGDRDCLIGAYDRRLGELARAAGDERGVTGSYGYQLEEGAGTGDAVVIREADGALSGDIETVSGPAYHICGIAFDKARPIGDAWLWEGPADETFGDSGPCRILFTPVQGGMRIDSLDCRYYCGANGWFDEVYTRRK